MNHPNCSDCLNSVEGMKKAGIKFPAYMDANEYNRSLCHSHHQRLLATMEELRADYDRGCGSPGFWFIKPTFIRVLLKKIYFKL